MLKSYKQTSTLNCPGRLQAVALLGNLGKGEPPTQASASDLYLDRQTRGAAGNLKQGGSDLWFPVSGTLAEHQRLARILISQDLWDRTG